jgi:hypothetical protein
MNSLNILVIITRTLSFITLGKIFSSFWCSTFLKKIEKLAIFWRTKYDDTFNSMVN